MNTQRKSWLAKGDVISATSRFRPPPLPLPLPPVDLPCCSLEMAPDAMACAFVSSVVKHTAVEGWKKNAECDVM